MKIFNSVLLLVAAALCIQAVTNEADLAEMGELDSDVGESAGLGRRGGGGLMTSGSFVIKSANRAGNDEEELGEEDDDSMFDSSGHDVASGRGARRVVATLSTPLMLASCKKSWPFRIDETGKTIHACVECKPGAPLPMAIAKHGEQIIWACDANKFKRGICEKSLSWLSTKMSRTGHSAKQVCSWLNGLVKKNNEAAKSFSKHRQGLKFGKTLPTSKIVFRSGMSTTMLFNNTKTFVGYTRLEVQRTVSTGYVDSHSSNVFIEVTHSVRACGQIPGQPLQCLEQKRSECTWSLLSCQKCMPGQFRSGKRNPGKVSKQGSCDSRTLELATSSRV